MANGEKRRKSPADPAPDSFLEQGIRAWDEGDLVRARFWLKKAQSFLSLLPEQAAAARVGKRWIVREKDAPPLSAQEIVEHLLKRTATPPSAYGYALLAAGIIALMIFLAHARGA